MKKIVLLLILIICTNTVLAFEAESSNYQVTTTTTGLTASDLESTNTEARLLWDFIPGADAEAPFYFLHTGYFQTLFSAIILDTTAPNITINSPGDGDTVPTPVQFDINIDEPNPSYTEINVNGTIYNYTYNDGSNLFSAPIPEGIYTYNVTAYDDSNNSATVGPFSLIVNDDAVSITSVTFSPNPPKSNTDNTLSAVIDGGFSTVILSLNIAGAGWTNYTITSFTGTGPYNYFYELDNTEFDAGDTLSQQWFVLDNLAIWQQSNIYNATVQQQTSGSGSGSWPDDTTTGGRNGSLLITPDPIQINNLRTVLLQIKNNGSTNCEITSINIQDTIGSTELQDNFNVNSLDADLTLEPNKNIDIAIKAKSLKGIAGTGKIIVNSQNCGETTANLGVNIHFTDVLIDEINRITNEVINYITSLLNNI